MPQEAADSSPSLPGPVGKQGATHRQRSVVWSCGLALVVTLTLVLSLFCYADYSRDRDLRMENLEHLRRSVSWSLAQMMALPLHDDNMPLATGIIESLMLGDPRIAAVRIDAGDPPRIAIDRSRDDEWRPSSSAGVPAERRGAITSTYAIRYKDAPIGHVTVWITDRFEREALATTAGYRIVGILLADLLLAAIIGYVFRLVVVLPLRAVEAYAFQVSNGEENAFLPKGYFPKELENLRASIERMVAELASQYEELFTANAALAAAKEQYQGVFQNAIEGIYQVTLDGTFIVVNPAMAYIFGYLSPDAFMADVTDAQCLYVNPGDRECFLEALNEEGIVHNFEMQYRRKDGHTIWLSETARLYRKNSSSPYFIYGMTQDVTNRRLAEDARRESEEKYRALMECANDAVFMHEIRPDGQPGPFLEVNKEACQRLGYTRETLMRMTPFDLDPPRYRKVTLQAISQLRQKGVAVFETEHMARDGHSIPVEVSSRLVELHGKSLSLSIARDITERKRNEHALLESEARLRSQLESILSPETDIDTLELEHILDIPALQSLLDRFVELTGTSIGLIGLNGQVLIPAGWQEVCINYHCLMEQTGEFCIENDTRLTCGLKQGEYVSTKCGNGMWHVFTPLYIGERHVANVFVGQFFYDDEEVPPAEDVIESLESPSMCEAYIAALGKVPRFSRYKVEAVMQFLVEFAELVSHLGYGNMKLAKALLDQKRVEEDLRRHRDQLAANQQKLSLAMSLADLVSWEYDYATDTFMFDQKFFSLFGPCREGAPEGRMTPETYAREYLLPEHAGAVRKGIGRFGQPGMPATSRLLEQVLLRQDGTRRTCAMKCTLLRGEDGTPLKIIGATQDITERKLAEFALRESEARYRGLVESLPLGVAVISPTMRIVSMNARMRTWYPDVNLNEQPLCYRKLQSTPREAECEDCPVLKTLDDGRHHESMIVVNRFCGPRYFRLIASPIRNPRGEITGVIKIQDDITEQVEAERVIRKSERNYRMLLDNIPLNICYKDKSSVYRGVNEHCARVFDVPIKDFPGLTDYDLFERQLADRYRADDRRVMNSGVQEEFDEPFIYGGKEGIFHVIKTPIRDEKGQVESVLVIFWDVTEFRRIEVAMREAEKMAAVGTLAGGIAHDFNNILGSISNLALLAKRELPPGLEAKQDLEQILESANVGKELVRQLLTFRRPEKEVRKRFDPAAVVAKTLKLMLSSLPSSVEVRENLVEGKGMILADPSQFRQVVLNLCSNAVDAMQQQQGVLTVGLEFVTSVAGVTTPQLSLAPGRYAALTVADTGQGIDPEIRDRIFEPFVTSKPKRRGTGLGLAVVHSIVTRHGGAVTVQSRMGNGTSFTIYFPSCEVREPEPEKPTVKPVAGSGRILLVDDEIILAQSDRRLLEALGYAVTVCGDGESALTLFQASPEAFDLVMTDLTMPGMNGKELTMRILALRRDIPIILCTGYSDLLTPEEAEAIGVSEYVLKPVDWNKISVIIDNLLHKQA